jgi:hypothetical protein
MSGVMFALFRQVADQGHLSMLQDWVLSALPNFTHRSPLSHSIWCLTVFFVCAATTNPYLQVLHLKYCSSMIREKSISYFNFVNLKVCN